MDTSKFPTRFARTAAFYGDDGFAAIRSARVTVIGLGGVGAHAAHALARSGIGELTLIDFDKVTATSLNRHPVAGPADLDKGKAIVMADFLALTCPDTKVLVREAFYNFDTADELLGDRPDYVIDAIDSRGPKASLLEYCANQSIAVVCSMGASARHDINLVRVDDLADTHRCPLARQIRRMLRRRGVTTGITCVYSTEEAPDVLPPEQETDFWQGRPRNTLPSQISIPGTFGYTAAAVVLQGIADNA